MNSGTFSRRNFTQRFTTMLSAVGLISAGLVARSEAKDKTDKGIRKLNNDGTVADGKQMITPIVIHNGMLSLPYLRPAASRRPAGNRPPHSERQ